MKFLSVVSTAAHVVMLLSYSKIRLNLAKEVAEVHSAVKDNFILLF